MDPCAWQVKKSPDGYCDTSGGYNTPACGYDGGDCCYCTCVDSTYDCGVNGFSCADPGAGSPDHGCVPYPSPSPSFTFAPTHSLAPTSTCEDTCYSQTCDYWAYYGYTCTTLEDTYGCDCSGCCAPTTQPISRACALSSNP